MNDQALQGLVEKISSEDFGRKFKHRAFFNGRLRTTGGRYRLQDHDIEINPKMLTEHGSNVLIGIIKHELCHYHLHLEGKGYKHKDPEFKALLKKVDGLRYAPELKSEKPGLKDFISMNAKMRDALSTQTSRRYRALCLFKVPRKH